jgi:hypothetical protein
MLVVAETGDVAVALCVSVEQGNRSKAVRQILDPRVDGADFVGAKLTVELVVLVTAGDGHDDIAQQFVIDTELERVGHDSGRAGVGCLRHDLP